MLDPLVKFSRHSVGALLLAFAAAVPAWALDVGAQAPALELPGNAQTVSVPERPGKVIYVDFWASWCGTCRQSFPWMNAMQQKYKSTDFEVIGINLDAEAKDAADFLARVPARFTIAYDPAGDSARRYGVKGMPTSFLIGRDGKVIHQHSGFNEDAGKQLEQLIQSAVESAR